MSEMVWILGSEKGISFGNAGVSGSYILPKSEVNIALELAVGGRLWVVLRGLEDRLFLLLKIKQIDRIIEGYHEGDYLISPEITKSIRTASDYLRATRYETGSTRAYALGLSEISQEASDKLKSIIRSSTQTKLLRPSESTLSKIHYELFPNNARRLAKSALSAILSNFTLEEVWANRTKEMLSAFSYFAFVLLAEKTGSEPTDDVVAHLRDCDPVQMMHADEGEAGTRETTARKYNTPRVDTEFSEIDPASICAREFVSTGSNFGGYEDAIRKTENAEKVHQAMLRDIAEYLIENGITPYESKSVDLFYKTSKKLNLVEIKSSSADNLMSQSSKGAFQLACYLNELEEDYDNLHAILVLHVTQNYDLQKYVLKVLFRMGVEVLFYDPSEAWPNRIQGLRL